LLRTEQEIATVVQVQHAIIRSLWPLLAPGGLMVYATCSIMPEENEQQIAAFVAEHPDCSLLPLSVAWGRPTGHGRQIIPGEQGMDGFFYSVLVKSK
jgi:16S rRNA (cytosine967-C5)-methyltransferase